MKAAVDGITESPNLKTRICVGFVRGRWDGQLLVAFLSAVPFPRSGEWAGRSRWGCGTISGTKEDKAISIEKLWRKFFADPSLWWDNRLTKKNHRFPDFVHRGTKEALWIDCWSNPSWVEAELARLKEGDGNCGRGVRTAYLRESGVICKGPRGNCARVAGNDGYFDPFQGLKTLCQEGQLNEAVELVYRQGTHASTNDIYRLLLGCIDKKDLSAGREVQCLLVRRGFGSNTFLGCCLIRMFTSCGSLLEARRVFSKLPKPNVFAWSAIISAHAELGQNGQAIELYYQMQQSSVIPDGYVFVAVLKACSSIEALDHGTLIHADIIESGLSLNVFVGSTLIDVYAKCGSLEDAHYLFDQLPNSSVVTWNTMIAGYVQHFHGKEALRLFQQMQDEAMEPNNVTFVCILKACSSIAALEHAKVINALMIERGCELDGYVGNALIGMYAKCGSLLDAHNVFDNLSKHDVVAWSAMIAGCAQLNDYPLALQCFQDMLQEGSKPNDVVYICLLSACSHGGLLDEGCYHFTAMREDHGILPTLDHFNVLVDLLGRVGCLNEAEDLLQTMPFSHNTVGWKSLLSHCRTHGNVDLAECCFDFDATVAESRAPGLEMMSNIYAGAGMLEKADEVQELRNFLHAWKKPGSASIEINFKVHDFIVGDKSHSTTDNLYSKLKTVTFRIKNQGHVPHVDCLLESSDGDEERSCLEVLRDRPYVWSR